MNRLYRKITWLSLLFYLGSTAYVRFDEFNKVCDVFWRTCYSLPWDAFPLSLLQDSKKNIFIQMGILSSSEIVNLLETNSETVPHMHNGIILDPSNRVQSEGDYLVIRLKNQSTSHFFDVKYCIPCFNYYMNLSLFMPNTSGIYRTIIIPHPRFLEEKCENPSDISMRWKYFW